MYIYRGEYPPFYYPFYHQCILCWPISDLHFTILSLVHLATTLHFWGPAASLSHKLHVRHEAAAYLTKTTVVLFLFYFVSARNFLVDVIQKLHILNNFVSFRQISQGSGLSFSGNHDTSPKVMTTHKMTETDVRGLLWWCQTLGAKALSPQWPPKLKKMDFALLCFFHSFFLFPHHNWKGPKENYFIWAFSNVLSSNLL